MAFLSLLIVVILARTFHRYERRRRRKLPPIIGSDVRLIEILPPPLQLVVIVVNR
jgi:hypothetical protein